LPAASQIHVFGGGPGPTDTRSHENRGGLGAEGGAAKAGAGAGHLRRRALLSRVLRLPGWH